VLSADESGGALHRATIRNRLRYLRQLEGRPVADWFSPHAMRRACATHNYERGVDLVAIQQLLGHWTVALAAADGCRAAGGVGRGAGEWLLAEKAGLELPAASVSALLTKDPRR
jgi:hypothetical protein